MGAAAAQQPAAVSRHAAFHIAWPLAAAVALQHAAVAWTAAAAVALAPAATVALQPAAVLLPASAVQSADGSVQSAAATGQVHQPNENLDCDTEDKVWKYIQWDLGTLFNGMAPGVGCNRPPLASVQC